MRRGGAGKRRDANEPAIIQALEAVGAKVFQLNGAGVPDLLVGFRGRWLPMEVKTAGGELTPLQWGSWGDCGYPIVSGVEDALRAIGAETAHLFS